MEVILIQDVDNLGAKNEVVKVKNGYARNYLVTPPTGCRKQPKQHESNWKKG